MNECVIDYCESGNQKILTVTTDERVIMLGLCTAHSEALRRRLAAQLGMLSQFVDLGSYGGTIGELQEAVDYLDSLAAQGH